MRFFASETDVPRGFCHRPDGTISVPSSAAGAQRRARVEARSCAHAANRAPFCHGPGVDRAGAGGDALALVLFADASRIDLGALRRTVDVAVRCSASAYRSPSHWAPWPRRRFRRAERGRGRDLGGRAGADRRSARISSRHRAPGAAADAPGAQRRERPQRRHLRAAAVAAVAIAEVESEISGGRGPATLLLEEIGYGALGGVAAGLLIAAIVTQAGQQNLIAPAWRQVVPAAGAACA